MKRQISSSPAEDAMNSSRISDSGGNQGRLNSGCVCNEGCESCDALAEAFEAMREALEFTLGQLSDMTSMDFGRGKDKHARNKMAAALVLAEEAQRGR